MLNNALLLALALIGIAILLCLYRLLRGPDLTDRVLALDTLFINSIGMIVLLDIRLDTNVYFEVALLIAALGFVSTVALAKFMLRGDIVE